MFAGTAAAKVIARQQDLRIPPLRLIQNKIRLRIPLLIVTLRVEELLVEPHLRRRLQKSRGNHLVRVDVVERHRNQAAFKRSKRLHMILRTSLTTPESALAAAVRGEARNVRPPLP